ncbi:MAG: hypothetical protein U0263_37315 [Polyangiaceae bacterium]
MSPRTALLPLLLATAALGCGLETEGQASLDAGNGASSGAAGTPSGGSGGTSAGGSGGAGTGGVAGSGSGGSTPVNCASDMQCVPAAPAGWSYAFHVKSPFSSSVSVGPKCHDGADPQRFYSEPVASSCQACACGPLGGGQCNVQLLCAGNSTCAGPGTGYTVDDGDCHGHSGGPTLSCMLGPTTVLQPGTCTPSGGAPVAADPFQKSDDVCPVQPGASCGSGSMCVPKAAGVYAGKVCVFLPGDQACATDYPQKSVIFQKALDERKCSACTCTPATSTCLAEYKFYDDAFCATSGTSVNSTTCKDVSSTINVFTLAWGHERTKAPYLTGTCTAGGGVPSGAFAGDPNAAVTLCCRPVP